MLEKITIALLSLLIAPVLLFLIVTVVAMMIDGVARYDQLHDRCLKQATNGYDIQRCR